MCGECGVVRSVRGITKQIRPSEAQGNSVAFPESSGIQLLPHRQSACLRRKAGMSSMSTPECRIASMVTSRRRRIAVGWSSSS